MERDHDGAGEHWCEDGADADLSRGVCDGLQRRECHLEDMQGETHGVIREAIAPRAAPTTPPSEVSSLLGPDQEPVAVGAGLVQYETNTVPLQISRRHTETFQIQPGVVE